MIPGRGFAGLALAAGLAVSPAGAEGQFFGADMPTSLEDLRFGEIAPGVSVSPLWGDLAAGPSGVMLRLAPYANGLARHHGSDYHAVLVDGALLHWREGEGAANAHALEPGAYWFEPAGAVHYDANPHDAPVTVFIYSIGGFDPVFAE